MTSMDKPHEDVFLLRLPEEHAQKLHDAFENDEDFDNRFKFNLGGVSTVTIDGEVLDATLHDMPCVIETHKTLDKRHLFKTGDIHQMFICKKRAEGVTDQDVLHNEPPENVHEGRILSKKYAHGLAPPLKNVRKRRFRKMPKSQADFAPEIMAEVEKLIAQDEASLSTSWKVEEINVPPPLQGEENEGGHELMGQTMADGIASKPNGALNPSSSSTDDDDDDDAESDSSDDVARLADVQSEDEAKMDADSDDDDDDDDDDNDDGDVAASNSLAVLRTAMSGPAIPATPQLAAIKTNTQVTESETPKPSVTLNASGNNTAQTSTAAIPKSSSSAMKGAVENVGSETATEEPTAAKESEEKAAKIEALKEKIARLEAQIAETDNPALKRRFVKQLAPVQEQLKQLLA